MELPKEIKKAGIVFKVNYLDENRMIETHNNEYRNLMVLLNDHFYLESFGECGGMGRCGTCVVEIEAVKDGLTGRHRNETNTLVKAGISQPGMRLACQIVIDKELNNAVVTISNPE